MIKVNDSAEFKRLIGVLSNDIVSANIHWRMQSDLRESMTAFPLVRQQSNTFWHLTLIAHVGAAVSQLCRVFDQQPRSLHLLSWLRTIKENLHLFSHEEFRKRLANSAFFDSLAKGGTKPDEVQLDQDIALCKATDPLVKKLVTFRGSSVAHRSAALAREGAALPANMELSGPEFEELLTRASTILNRYSRLFSAETYSTLIIGARDFECIFKTVQSDVEAAHARTEELLRRP